MCLITLKGNAVNIRNICQIGLSVFLLSCGQADDKPKFDNWPKNSAPTATLPLGLRSTTDDQNLLGTWNGRCEVVEGKSSLISFEVKSDYLIYTKTWYQDLFCRTETSSFRFISEYRTESGRIYAQLAETHIKIESEGIRVAAEKSRSCGFDRWLTSTWHNVTGQSCPKTEETGGVWTGWTKPGTVILNQAYEVLGNKLIFINTSSSVEFTKQ